MNIKNLSYISILSIAFFISSCVDEKKKSKSSDNSDEKEQVNEKSTENNVSKAKKNVTSIVPVQLEGKWIIESIKGEELPNDLSFFQFEKDQSGLINLFDEIQPFQWERKINTLCIDDSKDLICGSVSFDGDRMIWNSTNDGEEILFKFKKEDILEQSQNSMDDMYLYDRYEDALESEVSPNTKENTSSYYNQEDLNNILDDYEKFINQYIQVIRKSQKGDVSALTEMLELLDQAQDFELEINDPTTYNNFSQSQLNRLIKLQKILASANQDL